MAARTKQDNDIRLYSYAELQTLLNILESNSTSYVPFTKQQILTELENRKDLQ